ncbi:MAG: hypothetical protein PVI41_11360 [Roseobacter sp.]|jgi:hypothetical protein
MSNARAVYVAETDENGRVEWVWVSEPGRTPARPVRNFSSHMEKLQTGEVVGAPRAAVVNWVNDRANRKDGVGA